MILQPVQRAFLRALFRDVWPINIMVQTLEAPFLTVLYHVGSRDRVHDLDNFSCTAQGKTFEALTQNTLKSDRYSCESN